MVTFRCSSKHVRSLLFLTTVLLLTSNVVDSFYTRYNSYPPYCSTPEKMATRKIPPLNTTQSDLKLLHVTAVIRHGARTPWGNDLNCWKDFWYDPHTAVWNCNLTAYLAPPPPVRATQEGATLASSQEEAMFLFEKRYDALSTPPIYSNQLNGTCQLGQLIRQGYSQELQNGKFLRQAYVFNSGNSQFHSPLPLLDTEKENIWEDIYYRVDDDERTLMSGQIVLRGLLGPQLHQFVQRHNYYPVIPLHTADRERDIMDPNFQACPRLWEIRQDPHMSPEFQALNTSEEATLLRKFTRDVLGIPRPNEDMHYLDCLMTTICTDRPLPVQIKDYGDNYDMNNNVDETKEYGENLFERLMDFGTQLEVLPVLANNNEYAKIGMGPLWYEILQKISRHLDKDHSAPKLAIFSGHDTTIIPLLASLGAWDDSQAWPPYASMVVLEIYESTKDHLFRLIYNGQVWTHQIPECTEELCNVKVLMDKLATIATLNPDCQRKNKNPTTATTAPTTIAPTTSNTNTSSTDWNLGHGIHVDPVVQTRDILSTPEGTAYLVLIVLVSALGGAALASIGCCCCMGAGPRSLLWRCRRRQTSQLAPQSECELQEYHHHDDDDPML